MIRRALVTIVGSILVLMLIGFVAGAQASERNQAVKFTFSQAVQLPGNFVLPSGTYWFEVPDVVSSRHIVQVFDADHKLIRTFSTIAAQRSADSVEHIQLSLGQMSSEAPMVMNWVYPGWMEGREFIYSPQQRSQLAETGKVTTAQIPSGGKAEIGK